MAELRGHVRSLDFTPPTEKDSNGILLDSETPLLPGYQIVHVVDHANPHGSHFIVRRVTARGSVKLAQRGIEEEYYTYPGRFTTEAEAEAAAAGFYAKDGPGDCGDPKEHPLLHAAVERKALGA